MDCYFLQENQAEYHKIALIGDSGEGVKNEKTRISLSMRGIPCWSDGR
jgi:hypothetical protein